MKSSIRNVWLMIAGGAALAVTAALLRGIAPEIVRYLRIRRM